MDRWRIVVSLVFLFSFGNSIGHARKLSCFGHRGGSVQGWFEVRLTESHMERKQEHSWLPYALRLSHEGRPFPFQRLPTRLQRLGVRKTSDLSLLNGVSQGIVCNTCLDISTFAEQVLADPETVTDVLEYINGSLCEVLPGFQEKCSGLAEMYVPEVVEMLQVYVAPDKLCGDTKLCASSSMLLLDDVRTCKVCTDFATEALTYMKDNKTESEVLVALHSECSKLGEFSARCNLLVDAYAPLYSKVVESVTPEQLCQKVGLCSALSSKGSSRCAACKLAILEMKAKLEDPVVQEKMLEMLMDGCSKMSNYVDQCKDIVSQYGPFILENLDTLVDAKTVCTKIHACEASPASRLGFGVREKVIENAMEPLIQLPGAHHQAAIHL